MMQKLPWLQISILGSLLALNVQMYQSSINVSAALDALGSEPLSAAELPIAVQKKLDEVDRLRATNAALSAVVSAVNFGPAREEGVTKVESFLPPLPTPPRVDAPIPVPTSLQAFFSGTAAPGPADPSKKESDPKGKSEAQGRMLLSPIRFRDNGALVYLAADGVVRVVSASEQVYGVNCRFIGEKDGMAEFEMQGRIFTLPLIIAPS